MRANRAIGILLMAVMLLAAVMVPAASALAYVTQYTPSSNQEVDVGTWVSTTITVTNYGMHSETIGARVWSDASGEICFNYATIGVGGTVGCSGGFTMPSETVVLYFSAYKWTGSEWVYNNVRTTTLTPKATPTPTPDPCDGVVCNNFCSGDTLYYNGYCHYGTCQYTTMTCPYGCLGGSCNPAPTPTPTPDPGTCTPNEKQCFGDYLKTCNPAGDGWDETKTEFCRWGCDAEKKECPCFEVVFAILGLLTVAYFVRRKRKDA